MIAITKRCRNAGPQRLSRRRSAICLTYMLNSRTTAPYGLPKGQLHSGPRAADGGNYKEVGNFLMHCRAFIYSLEDMDGKMLVCTKRKVCLLGILRYDRQYYTFGDELTCGGGEHGVLLRYLTTFRFSQDHLEHIFGEVREVRRIGGWSNNPTAKQFQYSYRATLHSLDIQPRNVSGNDGTCSKVETALHKLTQPRFLPELVDHNYAQDRVILDKPTRRTRVLMAGAIVGRMVRKCACVQCNAISRQRVETTTRTSTS